jgi:hypothetical protein
MLPAPYPSSALKAGSIWAKVFHIRLIVTNCLDKATWQNIT